MLCAAQLRNAAPGRANRLRSRPHRGVRRFVVRLILGVHVLHKLFGADGAIRVDVGVPVLIESSGHSLERIDRRDCNRRGGDSLPVSGGGNGVSGCTRRRHSVAAIERNRAETIVDNRRRGICGSPSQSGALTWERSQAGLALNVTVGGNGGGDRCRGRRAIHARGIAVKTLWPRSDAQASTCWGKGMTLNQIVVITTDFGSAIRRRALSRSNRRGIGGNGHGYLGKRHHGGGGDCWPFPVAVMAGQSGPRLVPERTVRRIRSTEIVTGQEELWPRATLVGLALKATVGGGVWVT